MIEDSNKQREFATGLAATIVILSLAAAVGIVLICAAIWLASHLV